MRGDSDRIQFAILFSEMNLSALARHPQEFAAFKGEISKFLRGSIGETLADRGGIMGMYLEPLDSWRVDDFIGLQKECKILLSSFAHREGFPNLKLTALFGFAPWPSLGIHSPIISGGIRAVFLLVIWLMLARGSGDKVRACPEESCGHRVFYQKNRRQQYCRPVCRSRAAMRRMREGSQRKTVGKSKENYPGKGRKRREARGKSELSTRRRNPHG